MQVHQGWERGASLIQQDQSLQQQTFVSLLPSKPNLMFLLDLPLLQLQWRKYHCMFKKNAFHIHAFEI